MCRRYGDPDAARVEDVEKPRPRETEVLIRVRAAGLNPLDWHLKKGKPQVGRLLTGMHEPNDPRMGVDAAGEVEAVGSNVTQFKTGDTVFGSCRGAFAEYACTAASAVVTKPENVTFEEAAAAPVAGYTALQALRDQGCVKPGQKVLINGAAGGVGTFSVQVAKWLGAEVTAVCSTGNVEMVRSLGADRVVDYTREDFTAGGERYDVILDLVANHSLGECRRVLKRGGTFLLAGVLSGRWGNFAAMAVSAPLLSPFVGQKLRISGAKRNSRDLATLAELMAAGKLKAVIAKTYLLDEVPAAIRHLASGHARGKIVVRPPSESAGT